MHCPGCTKHYGPSPSCPGCGHEELERKLAEVVAYKDLTNSALGVVRVQLAEAQAERVCCLCRTDPTGHPAVICDSHYRHVLTERDALKATLARVEASDAEIEQSIAALFPDEFPVYEKEYGGDGVSRCVGDEVPVSLVAYLCKRFKEQRAALEQAREAVTRCLARLKAERDIINSGKLTVQLDPRVHGMDVLIPLLEAALDAGSPQPRFPLALAQEWAMAFAALSSGRDAAESNRLELAYNAACERLYEALDAGKEAGG